MAAASRRRPDRRRPTRKPDGIPAFPRSAGRTFRHRQGAAYAAGHSRWRWPEAGSSIHGRIETGGWSDSNCSKNSEFLDIGICGNKIAPRVVVRSRNDQLARRRARALLTFRSTLAANRACVVATEGRMLIGSKLLSPASAGRPPRGCGGAARWCAETQRGTDMTKSKGRGSAAAIGHEEPIEGQAGKARRSSQDA